MRVWCATSVRCVIYVRQPMSKTTTLTLTKNRISDDNPNGTEPVKGTLKVAIIGTAIGFEAAPFHDESWEIWGLSRIYLTVPRWTRWFELHKPEDLCKTWEPGNLAAEAAARSTYTGWLEDAHEKGRVYSREGAIENTEAFPFEELVEAFPRGYFTNTIAWLTAYAIHIGATEIALWGVDMALDTEFGTQRPSCEYWLGVAEGRGIKITIPESSDLLKCRSMYAYEDTDVFTAKLRIQALEIQQRLAKCKTDMTQLQVLGAAVEGQKEIIEWVQRCWGEEG